MPVSDIVFQGINRAASDYSNAGACEELINLRPTGTGLSPVKPFGIKMTGITYDKVFVHKAGPSTNYIALKREGNMVKIYHISDSGEIIGEDPIAEFSVIDAPNFSINDVHYAYTGNIILFSIADKEDEFYMNLSYLWDSTEYKELESRIPSINIEHDFSQPIYLVSPVVPTWTSDTQAQEIKEQISSGLRAVEEENKEYCLGPVLVAIAFKTTDGNTFWTNKWLIFDPFPIPPSNEIPSSSIFPTGYLIDENSSYAELFPGFFSDHKYGFLIGYYDEGTGKRRIHAAGRKLTLTLSMDSSEWDEQTSLIRSVEIYASRPPLHVDPINAWGQTGSSSVRQNGDFYAILPQVQYTQMEMDRQLLYFQKSIPLNELSTEKEVVLQFGGNLQTTGKTLETDSGSVTRYGNVLAYNSRFHFFDSYKGIQIGMPDFIFYDDVDSGETRVFVVYNDGTKDHTVFVGVKDLPPGNARLVIAPFTNIKFVITQREVREGVFLTISYRMTESQRYNYSICIDNPSSPGVMPLIRNAVMYKLYIDEPSAINVTEQYNPFVFKVEHSYLAPGKVLDVQPQMVAVKDVSYGDYPLNVFTNRGLYALLQGDGVVLYGAFRSLSNLITTANSVPTEIGTFFIAAGNMWLVSGNSAVLISEALNPGPHKFIRDSAGYRAIAAGQYDVSELVSQVPFDEYVNGATLAYNRYRDELFVSNPDYNYTYVLSLKHRQWFKMSLKLSQDVVGSDIATVPLGTAKNIVDFTEELETVEDTPVSVLVHYQTRPFSIGYQYIHVHRLLSMIRASLSTDDLLIVGLYGSDNLQDWKLLSYASRSGIKISQIRTPSAARSWRYYTVCVGGLCPWDTDFGNTLFEYQPVVRRIG